MAIPQAVNTLTAKHDEIDAHIFELRRQLAVAERDLSSITPVLALYDLSPTIQTRFPAYTLLNRMFTNGETFGLCKAVLIEAGAPLTTREIALAVICCKRWDVAPGCGLPAHPIAQPNGNAKPQQGCGEAKKCKGLGSAGAARVKMRMKQETSLRVNRSAAGWQKDFGAVQRLKQG